MEVIKIPKGKAIIIICGPTSCGKSSIAYNILKKRNGEYISYEKIRKSIPRKMSKEKQILMFTKIFSTTIEKAVMNKEFVVIETPFIEDGQLSGLIVSLRIYGYRDKITLLKIFLPEEIHIDFLKKKHNPKPNKKVMMRERNVFEKEILAKDYSKNGGVNEFTISDVNNVDFDCEAWNNPYTKCVGVIFVRKYKKMKK